VRYEPHDVFTPPQDPGAIIWRYLDFTKLVSLLDSQALFFARADTLGDEFEGSYSLANVQLRPEIYKDVPPEALANLASFTEGVRRHTYVNCWNVSEYESAALWSLYVPPEGGVAIRSTFRRLTDCFVPSEEDASDHMSTIIFAGLVRYVDYDTEWIPEGNTMWPFVHKRRSFESESELRALIQDWPTVEDSEAEGERRVDLDQPSPPGRAVAVDLDCLVDAIHVSPIAPQWFRDLVTPVCARYGLEKPVVRSALSARPVY
jgi:hypothetical protein